MKKLMALLLATATAISMFAGSVSAINFDDEVAYTGAYEPVQITFGDDEITVSQKYYKGTLDNPTSDVYTKTIATGEDFVDFVNHLDLSDPYGAPEDLSTYVAMNPGVANDKYGKIYMYDYLKDPSGKTERELKEDMADFADLVSEILSVRNEQKAKALEKYFSEFKKAWNEAYTSTPGYSTDDTAVRYDALTRLRSNKKAIKNLVNGNGNLKPGIYDGEYTWTDANGNNEVDTNEIDSIVWTDGDVYDYNLKALFYDLNAASTQGTGMATSEIIYLNYEYERIISEVSYADMTTVMDKYYNLLDKVTSYVESDFTAAGWREVQEYLEEAEELAAEAVSVYGWQDAIDALQNAKDVRGKPVDYTDLQDALADLFVGEGKASDIKPDSNGFYAGDNANYIYRINDYKVRGNVSQEWADFAGELSNGNPTGLVDGEYAAFTEAYKLWKSARANSTSVKQSELDEALDELLAAVDALVSNADDVAEWLMVKLQAAVDAAEALNESDFNTATRKWEKLQDDIADAKEVLEKSKPSEAEVNRAIEALMGTEEGDTNGTYYAMRASAKNPSAANKKTLKELIRTADRLISNISTQTGAQVAALREATEDAAEVYDLIDAANAWQKSTISEVDAAIADLQAAIDNFNNPQGWYKEDGKWYYGIGAEIYADGWAQIGETWYMFNADGSLKQSEWFQVEGKWYWANENGGLAVGWAKVDGKWYFFDQGNAMKTGWVKVDNNWYYLASSGAMVTGWNWIGGSCYYFYNNGAMAANTTVGGYTVDANGAWVK